MSKKRVPQADIEVNVTDLQEELVNYPGSYRLPADVVKSRVDARRAHLEALNEAGTLVNAEAGTYSVKLKRGRVKWPK